MPDIGADPLIETPAPPLTRHGRLEVDAFCSRCNYNLHGQDVWLDDRLNFPICRCPECGQHYPAGSGVTAQSVWLRRFASFLMGIWIGIVLVSLFLSSLAFIGMQSAHVSAFSYWLPAAPNTQTYSYKHVLQPPSNFNAQDIPGNGMLIFICLVSCVLGFIFAALMVSLLWHWPRRRYFIAMLLPFFVAPFPILAYHNDTSYDEIFTWCRNRVLLQASLQSLGIFLGILLGRKLARLIVRSIIPPKPRQFLTFLWRADGKTPPPA